MRRVCIRTPRLELRPARMADLKREGMLKGFLKRAGEVRDEYIFGLCRADWKRHQRQGRDGRTG